MAKSSSGDSPIPISGVSTSTLGIVGQTERGPEHAQLVNSLFDFESRFGSYQYSESFLPIAVHGFFLNGGQRCFVARVTGKNARHAEGNAGNMRIAAIGKGDWGNRIVVRVTRSAHSSSDRRTFNLQVMYSSHQIPSLEDSTTAEVIEEYRDLPLVAGGRSVLQTINASSKLVRIWFDGVESFATDATVTLAGGENDAIASNDYIGSHSPLHPSAPEGLFGRSNALAAIDNIEEVSLLTAPDEVRIGMGDVSANVIHQCEELNDRFAIISVSEAQRLQAPEAITAPSDSSYAAFYHPWIEVSDHLGKRRVIPSTGHIAGVFARTDNVRGVHKAPANEVVRGATDVEIQIDDKQQAVLNPKGVNCVRNFQASGIRIWGARTVSSDPEWKYVNVRRLMIFLEHSIDKGTQWAVFEPNGPRLWANVRQAVDDFLNQLWRGGALQGATPSEAYFVKCDRTTMAQDDIDYGRLICEVGVAPLRPAEFVVIRIGQATVESS